MSVVPRISHGILSLNIETKEELQQSYMPFVTNGGLFVPTARSYQLGEEVFVLLTLMDDPDKIPVTGKVVWVTPKAAQGGKSAGIGIQLSPDDTTLHQKIETLLAGAASAGRKSHTF